MGMFDVLDEGGEEVLLEFGDTVEYRQGGITALPVFIQGLIDRVEGDLDPSGSGGQGNAFKVGQQTLHVLMGRVTDPVPVGIVDPKRDDVVIYEGQIWTITARQPDGMRLWMCALKPYVAEN